jgi:ABC-type glycerol-3-phosphate transport system permease component
MKKQISRTGGLVVVGISQFWLVLFSLVAIYPVFYMFVTSFKTRKDWLNNQFGLPAQITLDNYAQALNQGKLILWFGNSFVVTIASIVLSTAMAALAAYALARFKFPGRSFFLNTMIALMVVPPIVLIMPLFIFMVNIKLINTLYGLIIIYVGLLIPFSIYLLVSFFRNLPKEIFDAATMDGCSDFGILWYIVVPLSAPAFVTLVVVNALWVWNELLVALVFLQSEELKTLMPGLTLFKGHFSLNEPLIMAGTMIATIPMLLLYIFGQRYFVEGLVAGAVK